MKRLLVSIGLAVVSSILLSAEIISGNSQATNEYQIKAAFLYNFTQFVEWPAEAFDSPDDPFVIAIVGSNPFGSFLDETVRGEQVSGRPLVVKRFNSADEIAKCHILFVSLADRTEIRNIIDKLKQRPVLTVGDVTHFAREGGMIRFVTEQNKTKIRINLTASRDAGLTISSKLLRLAEIVETKTE